MKNKLDETAHIHPCGRIKNIDMFGENVKFTFRNQDSYTTYVGAFFSCVTFTFFSIFFVVCTNRLVSNTDPFFSMMTMGQPDVMIDLHKLNFFFAI